MTISDERFDAAVEAHIKNADNEGFAEAVGLRQELLLRTSMKDDLDGAFTVAVEEQLAA